MNYGNTFLINLRYLLAYLGILKIIKIMLGTFKKEYEKKYSQIMLQTIEKNIIIWDVGANKGLYIRKFLNNKKNCSVIAFEPTPSLYKLLKFRFSATIKKKKLFVYNYALSNKTKKTFFWISKHKSKSVENSLNYKPNSKKIIINQIKPDDLVNKKRINIPNFIKLDIEGGELNFLKGSKKILKHKNLRHLFIEVHFTKLNKLHGRSSVIKIINILKNSNFKIIWIDSSHLYAKK